MTEDAELLRRYAEEKSEEAFAELVRRQVNFVYACALRRVGGDAQLAEDVTQQVFVALARAAARLAQREVLSGWLFTTARNAAVNVVRSERRRTVREQEASIMNELTSSSARDAEWERTRAVLDDAMDRLSDADRQAVLLRFFEGKTFGAIAAKLRLNENAARMRVERALEKLRALMARRGVTSTGAALAAALANQAGVAAPAGLAATVTTAALTEAVASGPVMTLAFMSMTKLKVGIATIALALGVAGLGWQWRAQARTQQEIASLRAELERLERSAKTKQASVAKPVVVEPVTAATLTRVNSVSEKKPLAADRPTPARVSVFPSAKKAPDTWRDAGTATPADAFETLMWAIDRTDIDAFVRSVAYDAVGKKKMDDWFATLSAETRTRYGTPERAMALLTITSMGGPSPRAIQVLSQIDQGPEAVILHTWRQNADGSLEEIDLPAERRGDGWRLVMPARQVERSLVMGKKE